MSSKDRKAVVDGLIVAFGGSDLLGSVIQSDRRRGGRAPDTDEDGKPAASLSEEPAKFVTKDGTTTNGAVLQESTITDVQYDNKTSPVVIGQTGNTAEEPRGPVNSERGRGRQPKRIPFLEERVRQGEHLAQSPTTTVTLRLPRELNDWLDEYVHRSWPQKIRKQELVAGALRLLFARRGRPGEPILETDFLREAKP